MALTNTIAIAMTDQQKTISLQVLYILSVILHTNETETEMMKMNHGEYILSLTAESSAEHRMNDGKVPLHGNHCENDNGCCVTHALDEKVQLTHHL